MRDQRTESDLSFLSVSQDVGVDRTRCVTSCYNVVVLDCLSALPSLDDNKLFVIASRCLFAYSETSVYSCRRS